MSADPFRLWTAEEWAAREVQPCDRCDGHDLNCGRCKGLGDVRGAQRLLSVLIGVGIDAPTQEPPPTEPLGPVPLLSEGSLSSGTRVRLAWVEGVHKRAAEPFDLPAPGLRVCVAFDDGPWLLVRAYHSWFKVHNRLTWCIGEADARAALDIDPDQPGWRTR